MPQQFDVYRNPSAKTNRLWPFYLIIQNDYFDDLTTRIIVPLVSKNDIASTRKESPLRWSLIIIVIIYLHRQ